VNRAHAVLFVSACLVGLILGLGVYTFG